MTDKRTLFVPAIHCGHCVHTVQNELSEIDGVKFVKADEGTRQVVVEWEAPATLNAIKEKLVEIEYPATQELA
ncbi:MAG: heavy-metal-associated domain-containing protein [Chloroflexi bacterium]|nr:heavy-metal-associated domain-containing protein [Chloroflexota bacterium]